MLGIDKVKLQMTVQHLQMCQSNFGLTLILQMSLQILVVYMKPFWIIYKTNMGFQCERGWHFLINQCSYVYVQWHLKNIYPDCF